jgi:hypothetical protein
MMRSPPVDIQNKTRQRATVQSDNARNIAAAGTRCGPYRQ